ncbi:MAG: hypothetical protein PHF45_02070 [Candidatus Pacebacteria bacterium]|nr:hypothetical protein [Candidatus Paceibacterota bacterium]
MNAEELDNIKERVQVKKEQLSREKLEIPEDKELVKETIEERMEEFLKELPPGMEEIGPEMEKKFPLPADLYIEEKIPPDEIMEEAYIKLSELITIALEEGIPRAVNTALKTGNAFLIDKLRDSLVDRYYDKLKEKNLI